MLSLLIKKENNCKTFDSNFKEALNQGGFVEPIENLVYFGAYILREAGGRLRPEYFYKHKKDVFKVITREVKNLQGLKVASDTVFKEISSLQKQKFPNNILNLTDQFNYIIHSRIVDSLILSTLGAYTESFVCNRSDSKLKNVTVRRATESFAIVKALNKVEKANKIDSSDQTSISSTSAIESTPSVMQSSASVTQSLPSG